MRILKSLTDGRTEFDISRMRTICEKYILERLSTLESTPHEDIVLYNYLTNHSLQVKIFILLGVSPYWRCFVWSN